jgi:anti-sigma B factor antagonist
MTATTFCDSRGIHMLVAAWQQATATGTELRMLVPRPGIMRIIKMLGVDELMPTYDRLDRAVAGPTAPPDHVC